MPLPTLMQQPVDADPLTLPLLAWVWVHPGVTFVNAISGTVIWEVDEPIQIFPALRELSSRCGVKFNQMRLFNESGPLTYLGKIDDPVISVVLLNQ